MWAQAFLVWTNSSVYSDTRVQSPDFRVQSPASRVQHPGSSVQSPASRVQSPESSVQSPESSVQSPASRVQRPEPKNSCNLTKRRIGVFWKKKKKCKAPDGCYWTVRDNCLWHNSVSHNENFFRYSFIT